MRMVAFANTFITTPISQHSSAAVVVVLEHVRAVWTQHISTGNARIVSQVVATVCIAHNRCTQIRCSSHKLASRGQGLCCRCTRAAQRQLTMQVSEYTWCIRGRTTSIMTSAAHYSRSVEVFFCVRVCVYLCLVGIEFLGEILKVCCVLCVSHRSTTIQYVTHTWVESVSTSPSGRRFGA